MEPEETLEPGYYISRPAGGYIGNSTEKLKEETKNGSFGGPLHCSSLQNLTLWHWNWTFK
jgi:hypothetical protein